MTIAHDFKGAAKRLTDADITEAGAMIGVGEDEIHAVMEVEAAGSGFDKQGRPRILFERHIFYRQINPDKLKRAIDTGLAVKKWSRASYNKDQYDLLRRAMILDEEAALKSASWGLGQVMGFNHVAAGFATVQAMVSAFMESEGNQLLGMVRFIRSNGLANALRNHDWKAFARGYNGAGYAANAYDKKLAAAYAKWQRIKDTPQAPVQPRPAPKPTPITLNPTPPPISGVSRRAVGAVAGIIAAAGIALAAKWDQFTTWLAALF